MHFYVRLLWTPVSGTGCERILKVCIYEQADWDELNEKIAGRKKSKRGTIADQSHEDGTWEDENENMEAMNTDRKAANTAVSAIEGAAGMGTEITATVDAGGGSGGAAEVEDEIS